MEQMETAQETTEADKATERLLFSEECQLITFMSVVRGKMEATRFEINLFIEAILLPITDKLFKGK